MTKEKPTSVEINGFNEKYISPMPDQYELSVIIICNVTGKNAIVGSTSLPRFVTDKFKVEEIEEHNKWVEELLSDIEEMLVNWRT